MEISLNIWYKRAKMSPAVDCACFDFCSENKQNIWKTTSIVCMKNKSISCFFLDYLTLVKIRMR